MSETGSLSQTVADGAIPKPVNEPPKVPTKGPVDWARVNLFSSIGNTVISIVFIAGALGIFRWLLNLIFGSESNWVSVARNIRLLNTFTYPSEQYARVWFSVGCTLAAIALTLAAFNFRPGLKVAQVARFVISIGAVAILTGLLAPITTSSAITFVLVGVLIAALGASAFKLFTAPDEQVISLEWLLLVAALIPVAILWLVPIGRYEFADREPIDLPGTVNITTKLPWTIMMAVFFAAYLVGRLLVRRKSPAWLRLGLAVWWLVGPVFLIFLVLRDPEFDWSHVWTTDIPLGVGFALLGGLLLYHLTKPENAIKSKLAGQLLILLAALTWLAAFFGFNWVDWVFELIGADPSGGFGSILSTLFGLWPMLQKVRISILLLGVFALGARTFSGERRARARYASIWVALMLLMHWLITAINTTSTLELQSPPFLGGFALTITTSYYIVLLSFPLGLILALARTSNMPLFRVMSTAFIECIRGIPLITVLFFFAFVIPLFLPAGMPLESKLSTFVLGYTLFSAGYMAENIRGGLQAVRQGQFEAADALGLSAAQRSALVVVPQALRVSIPNIVGQAISTFKETSLIIVISGFDLLQIADRTISSQSEFLGDKIASLLYAALLYWVVSFTMSKYSQGLERKLGVGTR